MQPVNGNLVTSEGTIENLVDALGGGTPASEARYDVSQYSPRSGLILGNDGRVYDLIALLRGLITAALEVAARALVADNALKLNGRSVYFLSDSEWAELESSGQTDEQALYIKIPDAYLEGNDA